MQAQNTHAITVSYLMTAIIVCEGKKAKPKRLLDYKYNAYVVQDCNKNTARLKPPYCTRAIKTFNTNNSFLILETMHQVWTYYCRLVLANHFDELLSCIHSDSLHSCTSMVFNWQFGIHSFL